MLSGRLFFVRLSLHFLSVSYEVCLLVGLNEKVIPVPGTVLRRTENIMDMLVFVRFHFFIYFVDWMISNHFGMSF